MDGFTHFYSQFRRLVPLAPAARIERGATQCGDFHRQQAGEWRSDHCRSGAPPEIRPAQSCPPLGGGGWGAGHQRATRCLPGARQPSSAAAGSWPNHLGIHSMQPLRKASWGSWTRKIAPGAQMALTTSFAGTCWWEWQRLSRPSNDSPSGRNAPFHPELWR